MGHHSPHTQTLTHTHTHTQTPTSPHTHRPPHQPVSGGYPTLGKEDGVDLEASSVPEALRKLGEVAALQMEADLQGLPCALHLVGDGHVCRTHTQAQILSEAGRNTTPSTRLVGRFFVCFSSLDAFMSTVNHC